MDYGTIKLGNLVKQLSDYDLNMKLELYIDYLPNLPKRLPYNGLQISDNNRTMSFVHDWQLPHSSSDYTVGVVIWNIKQLIKKYGEHVEEYIVCHMGTNANPSHVELEPIRYLEKISSGRKSNITNIFDSVLLKFKYETQT